MRTAHYVYFRQIELNCKMDWIVCYSGRTMFNDKEEKQKTNSKAPF